MEESDFAIDARSKQNAQPRQQQQQQHRVKAHRGLGAAECGQRAVRVDEDARALAQDQRKPRDNDARRVLDVHGLLGDDADRQQAGREALPHALPGGACAECDGVRLLRDAAPQEHSLRLARGRAALCQGGAAH
eukprot:4034959-Prymnesium_polylepis.1